MTADLVANAQTAPIGEAVKAVADYFHVNPIALLVEINRLRAKTRPSMIEIEKAVAKASTLSPTSTRYVAIALCERLTGRKMSDIARRFCCQRTTAWRAVHKLESLVECVQRLVPSDAPVEEWAQAMLEHYDEIIGKH